MLFPFKSRMLQLDLAGLIWFEPAKANSNCGVKRATCLVENSIVDGLKSMMM